MTFQYFTLRSDEVKLADVYNKGTPIARHVDDIHQSMMLVLAV